MKTSQDRILTTHVGSLPRSKAVTDTVFAQERGESPAGANAIIRNAVAEVVGHLEIGPADVAEWLEPLSRGGWIASDRFSRLPARAPPV